MSATDRFARLVRGCRRKRFEQSINYLSRGIAQHDAELARLELLHERDAGNQLALPEQDQGFQTFGSELAPRAPELDLR